MKLLQISPKRADVIALLNQADEYAASLYPDESNHLDDAEELSKPNVYFIGAFQGDALVAMGAVKVLSDDIAYGEIKRVFVAPKQRGKGVSKLIMNALESNLMKQGIGICRLETGVKQAEAIGLYESLGYVECCPFGTYKQDPLSLFMEKILSAD